MKKYNFAIFLLCCLVSSCVHTDVDINGNLSGVVTSSSTKKPIEACAVIIDDGALHSVENGLLENALANAKVLVESMCKAVLPDYTVIFEN